MNNLTRLISRCVAQLLVKTEQLDTFFEIHLKQVLKTN